MSSLERLTSLRVQRAQARAAGLQRVRHGVRDQLLVMAFSAGLSLALAFLLAVALTHSVGAVKP